MTPSNNRRKMQSGNIRTNTNQDLALRSKVKLVLKEVHTSFHFRALLKIYNRTTGENGSKVCLEENSRKLLNESVRFFFQKFFAKAIPFICKPEVSSYSNKLQAESRIEVY